MEIDHRLNFYLATGGAQCKILYPMQVLYDMNIINQSMDVKTIVSHFLPVKGVAEKQAKEKKKNLSFSRLKLRAINLRFFFSVKEIFKSL